MKICIDAGHGGDDPGAVGTNPFRLLEKDVNLAIAKRLESELYAYGNMGYMTRETDIFVALHHRAKYANNVNADLFISIHCNAAANESVEGIEIFHFPGSNEGKGLANVVASNLYNAFGNHKKRGTKSANFAVLRLTNMPSILVECEFITNKKQLMFLSDPNNHIRIAECIAAAI